LVFIGDGNFEKITAAKISFSWQFSIGGFAMGGGQLAKCRLKVLMLLLFV